MKIYCCIITITFNHSMVLQKIHLSYCGIQRRIINTPAQNLRGFWTWSTIPFKYQKQQKQNFMSKSIQREEGFPDYGNFDYPQNTSHLFVEDYQPFWEFWVPGVLLPVVGGLGLIGNTFSIYILSRQYLDIFF